MGRARRLWTRWEAFELPGSTNTGELSVRRRRSPNPLSVGSIPALLPPLTERGEHSWFDPIPPPLDALSGPRRGTIALRRLTYAPPRPISRPAPASWPGRRHLIPMARRRRSRPARMVSGTATPRAPSTWPRDGADAAEHRHACDAGRNSRTARSRFSASTTRRRLPRCAIAWRSATSSRA